MNLLFTTIKGANKSEAIIYDFKISIKRIISKYFEDDSFYWLEDSNNTYFSNNLYIRINNIENKFRGIISQIFFQIKNIKKSSEDLLNLQELLTEDLIKIIKNSYLIPNEKNVKI